MYLWVDSLLGRRCRFEFALFFLDSAQLVTNVEKIIAIELFTACQAVEFLEPKKKLALLASPMGAVFAHVRKHIPLAAKDRYFSPEMEWCFQQIHSGVIADLMPFKAS